VKFKSFTPAVILSCLSTYVFAVSNDCSNADDCYQKAVSLVPQNYCVKDSFCVESHAPEKKLTSDSYVIFDTDYFSKAEKYLNKACQMSHSESCLILGLHFGEQPGNGGVILDFAKSLSYLRKSCELKNDTGCSATINLFKYYGSCCEADPERKEVRICSEKCSVDAITYLDSLCSRNNKNACEAAGYFIRTAWEISYSEQERTEKAQKYLKKGCELDNALACADLADIYDELHSGDGHDSFNLYLKACQLKDGFSCGHIGKIYFQGEKVKKDLQKAVFYLKQGCDLDDYSACEQLTDLYEKGKDEIKPDSSLAEKYRQRVDELELSWEL
jgi:hypothetical protein